MKSEIAKLLLLGQYGLKKYVTKHDCMQLALFDCLRYIRTQFQQITMANMAYILKGIAIVYFLQIQNLEGDTKVLLSQINGDYAWSYINRRKKDDNGSPVSKHKYKRNKKAADADKRAPVRDFNIMDAK